MLFRAFQLFRPLGFFSFGAFMVLEFVGFWAFGTILAFFAFLGLLDLLGSFEHTNTKVDFWPLDS